MCLYVHAEEKQLKATVHLAISYGSSTINDNHITVEWGYPNMYIKRWDQQKLEKVSGELSGLSLQYSSHTLTSMSRPVYSWTVAMVLCHGRDIKFIKYYTIRILDTSLW